MAQGRSSSVSRGSSDGEARIGHGTRVRGRVSGSGDLVISGTVEGDITLKGALRIDEGGSATSTVEADALAVFGTLEGDVAASGPVHLAASANVRGDLRASGFVIDEGARFAGRLDCDFDLPEGLSGTSAGPSAKRRT